MFKTVRIHFLVTTLVIQSLTGWAQTTPSPYELRTGREIILLGTGIGLAGLSRITGPADKLLDLSDLQSLNRQSVNGFDRRATYQYSPAADRLSDVTLAGTALGLGALTFGTRPMRRDWLTVGVMYVETILIADGIKESVKTLTGRFRPFVYNPDVPLSQKTSRNARESFFSGHATDAFATAVFTGNVFRHYFPDSKLKTVVWIGSLGLATATAVLRYEAGQHYPTDLIAGAAFGSLVGWGIPKLHEVKNRHSALRQLDIQPWHTGQATGLYARWTFSSTKFVIQ